MGELCEMIINGIINEESKHSILEQVEYAKYMHRQLDKIAEQIQGEGRIKCNVRLFFKNSTMSEYARNQIWKADMEL